MDLPLHPTPSPVQQRGVGDCLERKRGRGSCGLRFEAAEAARSGERAPAGGSPAAGGASERGGDGGGEGGSLGVWIPIPCCCAVVAQLQLGQLGHRTTRSETGGPD